MTYKDLINHYGTGADAARALGLSHQAVWLWQFSDEIPPLRQYQIEVLTKGELKASSPPEN